MLDIRTLDANPKSDSAAGGGPVRGIILLGFLSGMDGGAVGEMGVGGSSVDCSPQHGSLIKFVVRGGPGGRAGDLDRYCSRIYFASIAKSASPGDAGRGLLTFGGSGFLMIMLVEELFEGQNEVGVFIFPVDFDPLILRLRPSIISCPVGTARNAGLVTGVTGALCVFVSGNFFGV